VTPSLIIPASALIFNDAGLQVLVAKDGAAHLRKVIETRDLGTEIEVADGVVAGDRVVLNPPIDLGDGGKLTVRLN